MGKNILGILFGALAVTGLVGMGMVLFLRSSAPTAESTTSEIKVKETTEVMAEKQDMFLDIQTPASQSAVNKNPIEVSGRTVVNGEVTINEKETAADNKGYFKVTINLDLGENMIVVVANDTAGNFIEKELSVTYEP